MFAILEKEWVSHLSSILKEVAWLFFLPIDKKVQNQGLYSSTYGQIFYFNKKKLE